MRYTTLLLLIILIGLSPLGADAQTRVEKHILGSGRGEGVVYTLPRTLLKVYVKVDHETDHPGEFAKYSKELIGHTPEISKKTDSYKLISAKLASYGVPDPEFSYQVEYKKSTVAPFVSLTQDGLLCAINADYSFKKETPFESEKEDANTSSSTDEILMSQEFNSAITQQKRASVLAQELQSLLESKLAVISGDVEQAFPDGQAMKIAVENLDKRIAGIKKMFSGYQAHSYTYPEVKGLRADSTETYVAFRFSPEKGVVDSTDLSGEPVYLDIKVTEKAPTLSEREAEKAEKRLKGIVYYRPGRVEATLRYNGKVLDKQSFPIAQLGARESLARVLFNTRGSNVVSVIFYPETAAIRQIQDKGEE